MAYEGDIRLGDTIDIKFTTRQISGAPFTLAGTPVISAYFGNNVTQITAGVTLTVDFDGVTGLNNVRVVASSGNGFATATNIQLVITTGTVNSVSVVGEVIATFSIECRSALMPTTAARTANVSSGGLVDADAKAINAVATTPVTTVKAVQGLAVDGVVPTVTAVAGLTASNLDTTISSRASSAQAVTLQADTDDIQTRIPTALTANGNMKSSMVEILTTALTETAGLLAGGFKKFFNVAAPTLTALGVDQTGDSFARIGTAGVGLTNLGDTRIANLDATISSRTKPADTQAAVTSLTNAPTVGDFTAAMKTSLNAATPAVTVSDKTGFSLSAAAYNAAADALIARNIAGGSSAGRTIKQFLATGRNKVAISGGTITVYDVDDTTPLWDGVVTTAAGNPLSSIDPS